MDIETLLSHKDNTKAFASTLTQDYIKFLVPLLSEKKDEIRNAAFFVLCERSIAHSDVYPYWNVFLTKLSNENATQRSIAVTLIGANIRWDHKNKFTLVFQSFMSHCSDTDFATSRVTLKTIPIWARYVPELMDKTISALVHIRVRELQDNQRKLILMDLINALIAIREVKPSELINQYLIAAMSGGLLDKRSVEKIEQPVN